MYLVTVSMYSIPARLRTPRCRHVGRESASASSTRSHVTHITPGQGRGWDSMMVWSSRSTKTSRAELGISCAALDVAPQRTTHEVPAKQRSSGLKSTSTTHLAAVEKHVFAPPRARRTEEWAVEDGHNLRPPGNGCPQREALLMASRMRLRHKAAAVGSRMTMVSNCGTSGARWMYRRSTATE